MGGNAFAHAVSAAPSTLYIPRMTPAKYRELKQLYETKLRQLLPQRKVNILKEAPEKGSYGDMDFLVESSDEPIDWQSLARRLGAAGLIIHSSGKVQNCSLAVPMDGSVSPTFNIFTHKHNPADLLKNVTSAEYAQIDLEVVPRELFEWHSFYASYGDMSGLLGHMVHNVGFTICDKGLMLRLAALDAAKDMGVTNVPDKAGRIFLSNDPQQVLSFLGLSFDEYQQGFTTVDEFYRWLAHCTLLSKDSVKVKRNDASGRQKERKRPLYSNFFNTWLPAFFEMGTDNIHEQETLPSCSAGNSQRENLQLKAVAFFDRKPEFELISAAFNHQIQSRTVDSLLKPLIAQHSGSKEKKLNEIVKGFRRWVGFHNNSPYVLDAPHEDDESELHNWLGEDNLSLQDKAKVDDWVQENWESIKGLERKRAKSAELPA
jgi:hypothetical protein